jgi:hypothetical protein
MINIKELNITALNNPIFLFNLKVFVKFIKVNFYKQKIVKTQYKAIAITMKLLVLILILLKKPKFILSQLIQKNVLFSVFYQAHLIHQKNIQFLKIFKLYIEIIFKI